MARFSASIVLALPDEYVRLAGGCQERLARGRDCPSLLGHVELYNREAEQARLARDGLSLLLKRYG